MLKSESHVTQGELDVQVTEVTELDTTRMVWCGGVYSGRWQLLLWQAACPRLCVEVRPPLVLVPSGVQNAGPQESISCPPPAACLPQCFRKRLRLREVSSSESRGLS